MVYSTSKNFSTSFWIPSTLGQVKEVTGVTISSSGGICKFFVCQNACPQANFNTRQVFSDKQPLPDEPASSNEDPFIGDPDAVPDPEHADVDTDTET